MKRLESRKDCKGYTNMKQVFINLSLVHQDYTWLISDIEAYPRKKEIVDILEGKEYLILTTKELVDLLDKEDFQWAWAVFSAIPSKYLNEDILSYDFPYIQPVERNDNPFLKKPHIQHPLADFEIWAWDSSGMCLVAEDEGLLNKFKANYPLSKETD